jgi:hypothetical protein
VSDTADGSTAAGAADAAAAAADDDDDDDASGTHVVIPDSRNDNVLVGIRDGTTDAFDVVWRPQVRVGSSLICSSTLVTTCM